ncbi:Uncharacterized protein BP5553_02119 [Venustampulla echinocandica]|uniref:CENP-V/GFA domain-containing protein n=1 Tax=Venustampulla echinocandica TaxID=2656787 RepID=A0A370U2Y7_9HELO|nr:Uncharacterized protein BP5553_02119 [Venustampulla echinocandica]RDL42140.1 Uncharacterized protein BP5553_02119 [Venustampulla echinocandica]
MALGKPKTITGGCLCEGVRFRIDFSEDHDWKRGPHTCQCTQCRKNCGSLIYNFHSVTSTELTWLSKATYAEYNSSPGCYRAFCKTCGSTLSWSNHSDNDEIELAVGTFDEEYLVGGRDEEDQPKGTYGVALANLAGDHFYVRNDIKGVTDWISKEGTRFWTGSEGGPVGEGK